MSEGPHNRVVKCIDGLRARLGGEPHSGWVPPGTAIPQPTPIRDVLVNLRIELNEPGPDCLLIQQAQDGSFCWDSWHPSVDEAEKAAHEWYGADPSQWVYPDSK